MKLVGLAAALWSLLLLGGSGCQGRPVRELVLADVALRAAQKGKADALAPDQYRMAENFYLRAKKDFSDGYYSSSRKYADQARVLAEKAEYRSLWKQAQAAKKGLNTVGSGP